MLKRAVWWSCPVWLSLASAAPAGIVFEQLPNLGGGGGSDTAFYEVMGFPEVWQLVADNVQVSESAEIRRVTWWGFYGGNFDGTSDPPAGDEYMRVRFYAPRSSDGLPDDSAVLYEETFLNASRAATGRFIFGGSPEFRYEANLGTSFVLQSSTVYWLEIVQLGDVDSHYRWSYGSGLRPGFAFLNSIVDDWRFTNGSYAFQLSTIPEPQAAALVGVSALVFVRWRRGRLSPC
ncbi:hypothetical protein B7486_11910 [cyanobacterium TDX16]|nr:hypothetical protein B7486_11910 [cyanobacterium TDX16]